MGLLSKESLEIVVLYFTLLYNITISFVALLVGINQGCKLVFLLRGKRHGKTITASSKAANEQNEIWASDPLGNGTKSTCSRNQSDTEGDTITMASSHQKPKFKPIPIWRRQVQTESHALQERPSFSTFKSEQQQVSSSFQRSASTRSDTQGKRSKELPHYIPMDGRIGLYNPQSARPFLSRSEREAFDTDLRGSKLSVASIVSAPIPTSSPLRTSMVPPPPPRKRYSSSINKHPLHYYANWDSEGPTGDEQGEYTFILRFNCKCAETL